MKHLLRPDDISPRRGACSISLNHFFAVLIMCVVGLPAVHATTPIPSEGYRTTNGFWVVTNSFNAGPWLYSLTRTPVGTNIVTNATIHQHNPGTNTNSSLTIPTNVGGFPVKALTGSPLYNSNLTTGTKTDTNANTLITNHAPILAARSGFGIGGGEQPSLITNLTIPSGVTQILRISDFAGAFENLTNLQTVNFPATLTNIGAFSFKRTGLRNLKLPLAVTVINAETFANCSRLTNADMGNGITTIGPGAFSNCVSLVSVAMPTGLRNLGESAFENTAFRSVSLPVGITSIPAAAFRSCTQLTNLIIPSSVTNIGDNAFQGARLASLAIPSSVTRIGSNAFQGIRATSVIIPSSVTNIGTGAFAGMVNLTNLVIPESVTSIGDGAFAGAVNLKTAKVPSRFAHMLANLGFGPGAGADALSDSVAQRILATPGNYGLALKADSAPLSPLNTNLSRRFWSAILSGDLNLIQTNATNSVIAGGLLNTIRSNSVAASIAGGNANTVGGFYSAVGGGQMNSAVANFATVGGGISNTASALRATVPGGARAKATNNGAFVWSGTDAVDTVSTNDRSFTVRAPGGVRFITTEATNGLDVYNPNNPSNPLLFTNGVGLAPNATAWMTLSDSNAKTGVKAVDPREILSKLERMPVTEWEYKHDPHRRYFGPMAQDFHSLFGLGDDDKTINTLDADGVLFLSVKGLANELKERDKAIEELKARNEELSRNIEEINRRLNSLPPSP